MKKKNKEKITDEVEVFPKQLYVFPCDWDGDVPVLSVDKDLKYADDGQVAVYELVKVGRKVTASKIRFK